MEITVNVTVPDDQLTRLITAYINKQFEINFDYNNRIDISRSGIIIQIIENQVREFIEGIDLSTEIKTKFEELYPKILDDVIVKSMRARLTRRFSELLRAGALEGLT